jgi:hypothetical protein
MAGSTFDSVARDGAKMRSVLDATIAQRMWRQYEPFHAVTYFAPESRDAYEQAGLRGFWRGYFAGRFAPLGMPDAARVSDLAFVFANQMVARAIPNVWELCAPERAIDARWLGVARALDWLAVPEDASALAREVAEQCDAADRPLARANLALTWPDEHVLALWQATTVMREHRGDGHVIALREAGLDGCEALVLHAATGVPEPVHLRDNRGWSTDEWSAATERLIARGWLDRAGAITAAGADGRAAIERRTDELAAAPSARADRFERALRPITERVLARGIIPYPNPMGVPRP